MDNPRPVWKNPMADYQISYMKEVAASRPTARNISSITSMVNDAHRARSEAFFKTLNRVKPPTTPFVTLSEAIKPRLALQEAMKARVPVAPISALNRQHPVEPTKLVSAHSLVAHASDESVRDIGELLRESADAVTVMQEETAAENERLRDEARRERTEERTVEHKRYVTMLTVAIIAVIVAVIAIGVTIALAASQ